MPYCSHCGSPVGEQNLFCAHCGASQPRPGNPLAADPLSSVSPRTLSMLCYIPVVGWVASVIVLGAKRFRQDHTLRFHAFQGLYIFAAWLIVDWAVEPIFSSLPHHVFRVDKLLHFALIAVWIFMMVKTRRGEAYSLPILGDLAERSVNERP